MEQASVVRAALVVAAAAVLDAVVVPYLTFGFFSPRLTLIAVGLRGLPTTRPAGRVARFFRWVLLDALSCDFFGVGALGGLLAAALSARSSAVRLKGERVLLAQVAGLSVAGYDLIGYAARRLAGLGTPQLSEYAVWGVLPDALINALIAFLIGGYLLQIINVKSPHTGE